MKVSKGKRKWIFKKKPVLCNQTLRSWLLLTIISCNSPWNVMEWGYVDNYLLMFDLMLRSAKDSTITFTGQSSPHTSPREVHEKQHRRKKRLPYKGILGLRMQGFRNSFRPLHFFRGVIEEESLFAEIKLLKTRWNDRSKMFYAVPSW